MGGGDSSTRGVNGTAPDKVTLDELHIVEMRERNDWARLELSLYFAWFGLQFTVNAAAFAALIAYKPKLDLARLVIALFVLWNAMGAVGSFYVRQHLLSHNRRITELLHNLTRAQVDCSLPPSRAPVSDQAIKRMLRVCIATILMSLATWTILEIFPGIFLSS